MTTCDYCGEPCETVYTLSLEWPHEEGPVDDPGRASLGVCEECADATATNILADRAICQGLEDIYDGLRVGEVTA